MSDLVLDKNYKKGMKGRKVELIQEWLCLNGFHVPVDGDFGTATDDAVKRYQQSEKLEVDGIVGEVTFSSLIRPMVSALSPIEGGGSLGEMVVAYAQQHLAQHPREVGGPNEGPWVRLYMEGNEGTQWPWCAGFVCFIMKQACERLSVQLPVTPTYSCDSLAASAKANGVFLAETSITDKKEITGGSFFLNRRTPTDWTHVGIVTRTGDEIFYTIEGNTNDSGDREGYEVCSRTRNYANKDFVLI